MSEASTIISFIRSLYKADAEIPLHAPIFLGNEKAYVCECIDSTFVSTVGEFVNEFERKVAQFTGAAKAVAVVNGTQALYIALRLAGAEAGTEVITQSLTFVATANAIVYTGAQPFFVDVDEDTLGMSPESLRQCLNRIAERKNGTLYNRLSGNRISCVVPMHTFGHLCRIEEIAGICSEFGLPMVEDAAESLGSTAGARHAGTFGLMAALSFNGNKLITTGGGGMLLTDNEDLARRAKHITTTARVAHPFEIIHDEIGFNFRMPNLNAALGVAQMENLSGLIAGQRELAARYSSFFEQVPSVELLKPRAGTQSNCWLNAVRFSSKAMRDAFLEASQRASVGSRAVWRPMHRLPMFEKCSREKLPRTENAYELIANLPSTVLASMLVKEN